VVNAYAVAFGGLLLLGGRAGDLLGRRRILIAGLLVFSLASLLGGLATGQAWLITARAVQGVGAAMAAPTALSLIAVTFPEGRPRNRAVAVYSAMAIVGIVAGLVAGGLLVTYLSWRWVLFVNVPIGLAVAALAARVLPETGRRAGRFDLPGALTATAEVAVLVYGLSNAATTPDGASHWGDAKVVASLAAAAVLLVAFAVIEARSRHPLLPFRVLRSRDRSGAYLISLCVGTALVGMFFFLTLFVQDVWGYSALKTAAAYLPFVPAVLVMTAAAQQAVSRVGARPLLIAGSAIAAGAMVWTSRITEHSTFAGAGQLAVDPVQDRGAQQQPPHRLGLPVQHLGQQVFGHRPLGPGELRRQPPRIGVPGQPQRGQPQPRRPALGPLHQPRHLGQVHPSRLEQLPRLGHGEPQIRLADLGQLALQPQPVQAQPHVMPGGQHEPQPRRGPQDQQLQLPQCLRAQLVHVVDHQPHPVIQGGQVGQQPLGDHPPVQVRSRRQLPDQRRPRRGLPQRGQHRQPELLRIPLAAPGRHPRGAARHARLAEPGSQQHRLAAARRRGHHGHPGPRREPPEQPGTGNDTPRTRISGTARNGARSGNRPHSSDHRTSPHDPLPAVNLQTCAIPQCGVRA
jgi:MFS family permease